VSNNGIVGHPYIGDQVLAVGTNPFYVATEMATWLLIVIICSGALFLIITVLII